MDTPDHQPPASQPKRATILQEIARFSRAPRLQEYEITIKMHAQHNHTSYSQAVTDLHRSWLKGTTARRKVKHNGTWKWAYAPLSEIPPDQLPLYDLAPTPPNT